MQIGSGLKNFGETAPPIKCINPCPNIGLDSPMAVDERPLGNIAITEPGPAPACRTKPDEPDWTREKESRHRICHRGQSNERLGHVAEVVELRVWHDLRVT